MPDSLILIAIGLAALVGAVLLAACRRPDAFEVRRSRVIAAPPGSVYPLIANLKSMNAWNPFVEPDPNIRLTYSGPELGAGARNTWVGNRNVGEGSFEITESEPPSRIVGRLIMLKPFKADNRVEFTLEPSGQGTNVTWAMSGRQPLLAKVMSMFFNCDRMVGGQFEKGLASLAAKVASPKPRS